MLGVVLAGGEARRMGRDKALLLLDGEALWARQVRVLRNAGAGRVVVIRRAGQEPLAYADCHFDTYAGCGPLAGIHAALALGADPFAAVLAVDMPGIDAEWFVWLRGLCGPGRGAVAGNGHLEPLAAIYPADALADVAGRLERGELSVAALARSLATAGRMSLAPVPVAYSSRLRSLNEPTAEPSGRQAGCS